MKEHLVYEELLPFYTAGGLSAEQRVEIEAHLETCKECQTDLIMWKAVSGEIKQNNESLTSSPRWVDQALNRVPAPNPFVVALKRSFQILKAQTFLVKNELWPVSALVMVIAVLVTLIAKRIGVINFFAPLLAASTLAALYGPENDPAAELTQSTPTSSWKILFARMSVVSCYNLLLSLGASLVLLTIVPADVLGSIIISWFGPLAFLSSMALLLSIWLGTGKAIAIAYSLWLLQYIPLKAVSLWFSSSIWTTWLTLYKDFWKNPPLLICLSVLVLAASLWSANKSNFRTSQPNQ